MTDEEFCRRHPRIDWSAEILTNGHSHIADVPPTEIILPPDFEFTLTPEMAEDLARARMNITNALRGECEPLRHIEMIPTGWHSEIHTYAQDDYAFDLVEINVRHLSEKQLDKAMNLILKEKRRRLDNE